jgi:hypothetical protein
MSVAENFLFFFKEIFLGHVLEKESKSAEN